MEKVKIDPISANNFSSTSALDELQCPPGVLAETRVSVERREIDGWLHHGVVEGTSRPAVMPAQGAAPRVKRDTSSRKRTPQKRSENAVAITFEDEIRALAYEFFEQRGRVHGHDVEDWLRAEEFIMIRERRGVAAA